MNVPLKNIKLPADRVEQIKQIAAGMDGATMSAALGSLIKLAREQGLVQHGIPSVTINSFPDGLALRLGDGKSVEFSLKDAQDIADTFREFLAGNLNSKRGEIVIRMFKKSSFSILGRGNGVKIAMPVGAEPFVFSRDLVEEFADLIEHEAAKAQA